MQPNYKWIMSFIAISALGLGCNGEKNFPTVEMSGTIYLGNSADKGGVALTADLGATPVVGLYLSGPGSWDHASVLCQFALGNRGVWIRSSSDAILSGVDGFSSELLLDSGFSNTDKGDVCKDTISGPEFDSVTGGAVRVILNLTPNNSDKICDAWVKGMCAGSSDTSCGANEKESCLHQRSDLSGEVVLSQTQVHDIDDSFKSGQPIHLTADFVIKK